MPGGVRPLDSAAMSAEIPDHPQRLDPGRLRHVVLVVALLNLAYFFVEFTVALTAGSV